MVLLTLKLMFSLAHIGLMATLAVGLGTGLTNAVPMAVAVQLLASRIVMV